jgi:16S rRNA (cytosine967-C5)-methyltransferase
VKPPHPSQVHRATALLAEILRRERPADVLLAECFRAHREMGGRDRAQVSDLVYRVLRHRRRYAAQLGDEPQRWIQAALVEVFAADADTLARMGEADPAGLSAALAAPVEAWEVQHNLPPWLAAEWPALLPEAEWAAAAAALQQPGTADFRVNRLKADPDTVLADLAARGVEAERCAWAPDGLRLARRLTQTDPLLREGRLIPQDEGSQWLVACLPLRPGERVLDYCAGLARPAPAAAPCGARPSAARMCPISPPCRPCRSRC